MKTQMNGYLEFVELDDYIAHLRTLAGDVPLTTHCEITSVAGKPGKFDVAGVTYFAALTYRHADYIATCAIPLLNTTTLHLRTQGDELRATLHANFDRVCALVRERGVGIERGKWTLTAPNYLQGE